MKRVILPILIFLLSSSLCFADFEVNGDLFVDDRIGIGTTAPTDSINVRATTPTLNLRGTGTGSFSSIAFGDAAGDKLAFIEWLNSSNPREPHLLRILSGFGDIEIVSGTGDVRIPRGNLGIGTTDPSVELDVVGDATVSGTINWNVFNPEIYTKDEVNDIVEGNTFDFFLNDTLSGIGAPEYFTMDPTETGEGESTFSDNITGDAFLIDSFTTTAPEPTFTNLVKGIYSLHIHADTTVGANVGTVRLFWELYRRTLGGVETLLLTSEESDVLTDSNTEYDIHGFLPADFMLNFTDLLVTKVYANIETSRPTDPLVTLRAEGVTATHFEVVTNVTAFDTRYILQRGDTTGAMTSDLNMDDGTLVISFDDNRVGIGTTNPQATVDIAGDLKVSSTSTFNDDVTIFSPTPILVFKDSDSLGAASVGFIEWRDSGGGRAGFLGNSSSGNDDLLWKNEQGGNIGIQTTGAGTIELIGDTNVTGNLAMGGNSITGALNITATGIASINKVEDTSLMGYWQMSGNADDSSIYGNDGTFIGGGFVKDVAEFDGDGDYIDVGFINMSTWEGITVCAWVRWNDDEGLFEHTIVSNFSNASVLLRLEPSNNAIECFVSSPLLGGTFADLTIDDSDWHYVCMTYDGTTLKVYLDTVVSTTTPTGSSLSGDNSLEHFAIGASTHAGDPAGDYFKGSIDEVKLYDRALSPSEILQRYNEKNKNFGHFNDVTITGDLDVTGDVRIEDRFSAGDGKDASVNVQSRFDHTMTGEVDEISIGVAIDIDADAVGTGITTLYSTFARVGVANGTLPNAITYGIFDALVAAGGHSIQNLWGIKINSLTKGTVSNTAIETGLGKVIFGDDVDVTGDITATGSISSANIGNQHDTSLNTVSIWGYDTVEGGFENLKLTYRSTSVVIGSDTGIIQAEWQMGFKIADGSETFYGTQSDIGIAWNNAADYLQFQVGGGPTPPIAMTINKSLDVFIGNDLDVTGDITATGTGTFSTLQIIDTNSRIEEDGSSNMTFTDSVTGTKTLAELAGGGGGGSSAYISITVTAKSSEQADEFNAFDEDNYSLFSSSDNVTPLDITFTSVDGVFDLGSAGVYKIEFNPILEVSVLSTIHMIIKLDSNVIYDYFVNVNSAVDPIHQNVEMIISATAGQDLEFFIDNTSGGNTVTIERGSILNIMRIAD